MPQTGQKYDGMTVYRRLLQHVRPYTGPFLLAIAGMILFSGTEAAFAWVIQPLLDEGFVNKDSLVLQWVPVLIIVIFALRIVGSFLSDYGMSYVARSVIRDLRRQMFDQFLQLPVRYYDTVSSGVLLSRMVYDVEQLAEASSKVVTELVRGSLTILALLVLLLYYSVQLTLILLVTAPFLAGLVMFISRRFRKLSHRIQRSMGDVSSVSEETIEANREIRIFGGQNYESRQFEKINEYNRRQFLKLAVTNALSSPVIQFIVAIAFASMIYLAFQLDMQVGEFGSYLTAMLLLMQHAKKLASINSTLQRGIAAAQSVFEFLDQKAEQDSGTVVLERATGAIRYNQVSFRYAPTTDLVLQDINLTIAPGQTVAFVGRSGAGKTTLVNLLPRFYELVGGTITLDGQDIREVTLQSLRSQMALVSQQVTLFNDTIRHNIAYGALESAGQEDVVRAARAAHALEFIEQLPEGFDTLVGENGVLLSGGQRQRLAIARAILKNAPVLILDEATSALDSESERHIQSALEELMQNRTTLVIAHRLSTIERADLIVVMHQGRIVEQGRHAELLQQGGHYAALHRMQFAEAAN
ncbi:MAG: lipid A export permease/ATP-binding protein MsbA [Proteobacteria bacterium]|jgi:subfamily B ATP-binding cassette protein MsbA|nr:lipid A export permease/ATP-binding protein MsbA [Pseudomonadota bacterium]